MATLNVTLNYLGVPIDADYVAKLHDGKDHSGEFEYHMLEHVLGVPPQYLAADVLKRYVEVSSKETYTPIFPHSDKLFERFLVPLKSAKRCYCLGEYLATIELCAHVGEMLALLIWQMTSPSLNGKPFDSALQKAILGRDFERLGQEQRINILHALGALNKADTQLMDFLRATRRKYFHFWDAPSTLPTDALESFLRVSTLVKNTLQIEFDQGAVKMNPALLAYLKANPQPTDASPTSKYT